MCNDLFSSGIAQPHVVTPQWWTSELCYNPIQVSWHFPENSFYNKHGHQFSHTIFTATTSMADPENTSRAKNKKHFTTAAIYLISYHDDKWFVQTGDTRQLDITCPGVGNTIYKRLPKTACYEVIDWLGHHKSYWLITVPCKNKMLEISMRLHS